jgi:Flp pilus assembly CpaE family ATPase
VVINRANLPGGINPKQIGKVLKLKHAYFVPYDSKLYLATSRGTSIIQEDPSAPSARAIKDLARQLRAKLTEPEPQPVKEVA